MPNQEMRILITAGLNIGKSLSEINMAVSGLEKKMKALKLKVEMPQDFQKSIQSFVVATNKMKAISEDQNKVVQENIIQTKKLSGSIETVTQKVLKNGEVISKTKTIHDESKKAIQDESTAVKKLTENIEKQNKANLDSVTTSRNRKNAITGYTVKSSQGYTASTTRVESDGETVVGSSSTVNHLKQRQDEQDLIEKMYAFRMQSETRVQELVAKNNTAQHSAIQKNMDMDREENTKRTAQLENFKAKYLTAIDEMQRRFGQKVDNGALNSMKDDIKNLDVSNPELDKSLTGIPQKIKQIGAEAHTASSHALSFGQAMSTALVRITQWGLSTAIIYGSLRKIKEGVSYVMDLNNALNEIRIVTGKSVEEVGRLAEQYNKLGKAMSVSTKDITAVNVDLFRQGLTEEQMESRTDAIIKYAKISGISLDQSNKIITATMNATGESAQKVIDIFSFLGDATASGADEIGEAMQRLASTSDGLGVSLEKASSWVAVISSKTRESAAVIGNSLKFEAFAA